MSIKVMLVQIGTSVKKQVGSGDTVNIIGQSGSGKGTACKKLGCPNADVGVKEGTKKQLFRRPQHPHLLYKDNPGHGTEKFPVTDYFETQELAHSLFAIFCCDSQIKKDDVVILNLLKKNDIPFFVLRCKADNLYEDGKSAEQLRTEYSQEVKRQVKSHHEYPILFCSKKDNTGWLELDDEIDRMIPIASALYQQRWNKCLESEIRKRIDDIKFSSYTRLAAVTSLVTCNGIFNWVPGLSLVVENGVMNLFIHHTREAFSLTDHSPVSSFIGFDPFLKGLLQEVDLDDIGTVITDVFGKEAVEAIQDQVLKQAAKAFGKQFSDSAAKQIARGIPLVSTISGVMDAVNAWTQGAIYLEECALLLEKVLVDSLKK